MHLTPWPARPARRHDGKFVAAAKTHPVTPAHTSPSPQTGLRVWAVLSGLVSSLGGLRGAQPPDSAATLPLHVHRAVPCTPSGSPRRAPRAQGLTCEFAQRHAREKKKKMKITKKKIETKYILSAADATASPSSSNARIEYSARKAGGFHKNDLGMRGTGSVFSPGEGTSARADR